jgi:hypothetical protein
MCIGAFPVVLHFADLLCWRCSCIKKNFNAEGKVEKYKARLVEKGYSHVEGIDFGDIFSPIANLTSIRFILSIVSSFDIEVEQMDVKKHSYMGIWKKKYT